MIHNLHGLQCSFISIQRPSKVEHEFQDYIKVTLIQKASADKFLVDENIMRVGHKEMCDAYIVFKRHRKGKSIKNRTTSHQTLLTISSAKNSFSFDNRMAGNVIILSNIKIIIIIKFFLKVYMILHFTMSLRTYYITGLADVCIMHT